MLPIEFAVEMLAAVAIAGVHAIAGVLLVALVVVEQVALELIWSNSEIGQVWGIEMVIVDCSAVVKVVSFVIVDRQQALVVRVVRWRRSVRRARVAPSSGAARQSLVQVIAELRSTHRSTDRVALVNIWMA